MHYFRSICSSLILFLISIILVANQSPIASGFETQGAKGPTSFDLGLPVHQDITREGLSFLKSDSLESIVSQHVKIEQFPASPNHFDNCQFAETVARINERYDAAIVDLNPKHPNLPQAEENFGYILHAAQDFYSHTNWVEMGRTDLIDPWLGHWRPLNGYTLSSNTNPVFILEEDGKPHSDFQIYKNGKVITVSHEMWYADGSGNKMGLISGTYDADISKCPSSASIPHGGATSTVTDRLYDDESRDLPDELNKDNPARQGFGAAKLLARQQTTHEFCRLVDLVKGAYGDEGVRFINTSWVQDQYLIDSPANNSRCPTADSTQVGLLQDSPTVEEKIVSIPSWIKHNAQYWSDGSLTDKDFATGIGYLVQHKIISTNVTTNQDGTILVNDNLSIPKWIKNNAKYWSEGSISDSDFKSGIEFMVNQKIISFSEPVNKQDKISNDDLKSLYKISKQYEITASSILILNNNQEKVLQGLTTSDWYKNTQDPKTAVHAQVLDLLIKKQDFDKQNIQQVVDATSDISNKIKDYALKQGVSSSELDKISSVPPKNQNSGNTPTSILKQSADDVLKKEHVIDLGITLTLEEKNNLQNQLANILGSEDSILEKFRRGVLNSHHATELQSLLDNNSKDLTYAEIDLIKAELESEAQFGRFPSTNDESKQHVLDLMQQAIDLLQQEELGETDSILNYIDDTSRLDLSPNAQTQSQTTPNTSQSQTTPGLEQPGLMPNGQPLIVPPKNQILFNIPSKIIQEATSSSGAIVDFVAATSPPSTLMICDHHAGTQFPLGNTVVTCTGTGPAGSVTKSFTVTVQDTTPPAISPFNPHNDTPDDSGAVVYFTTEAIDLVDGPVLIHCDHQSGTKFPMGDTIVTCTADDSKGNHASRAFKVSITKS